MLREHSKTPPELLGQDDPETRTTPATGAGRCCSRGPAPADRPHSGKLAAPGKRVLLTWNASRESAHALRGRCLF